MRKINVLIDDFAKRKELVSILDKMDVKAILGQGNSTVDARSLIGVMSIAPNYPIALVINESDEVVDGVLKSISRFVVE